MYRAVCEWRDLTNGHLYNAGEEYPFDGKEVSEARLMALLNGANLANKPLIERVDKLPDEEAKPRKIVRKPRKTTI